MPHQTPDAAARDRLRDQVSSAAGLAALDGRHPGHWHLHHIALPVDGPRDFTPYRAPEYAEEHLSPAGPVLEFLMELLTFDHAAAAAERGLEAGQ